MKRLAILTIFGMILMSKVWGSTVIGVKPATTSDDYHGLNNNLTTFGGSWLAAYDSTSPSAILGMSGSYGNTHAVRFLNVTIPQGATIDTAEYWVSSRCVNCTDTVEVRCAIYDADAGVQVVDTGGFRLRWASRSTTSGTIDTAYLRTVTSWGLNTYNRIPFNKLKSVIQKVVSRPGWTSGSSITLFVVPTAASPANSRAIRDLDNSSSAYDSLYIGYTASGGGGGGSTPNTIIRSAIIRSSIIR